MNGTFGANNYRAGGTYGLCDECGGQFRLSDMRMRWDKALVCKKDWEPRHPQEFVRGRADRIKYPGQIRPEPEKVYNFDTLRDESNETVRDGVDYPIVTDDGIGLEDL